MHDPQDFVQGPRERSSRNKDTPSLENGSHPTLEVRSLGKKT